MRLCRFGGHSLGLVEGDQIADVSPALEAALPIERWPSAPGDALIRNLSRVRIEIDRLRASAPRVPIDEIRLQSPVATPSKIVGAPTNYAKHLEEAARDRATFAEHQVKRIEETGLFLKAVSSLVGPGEGVPLRHLGRRSDHEVELVAVIGTTADRVGREHALAHVAGYAIGLDMSVRGPEERSFRKSIDGYTVLGPWLVTADELGDPSDLELELGVNGVVRQKARTCDLILDLPRLIEWASSYYTLHPGDLIFTGTPDGVGPVVPGDVITARIERIGQMRVAMRAAEKGGDRS